MVIDSTINAPAANAALAANAAPAAGAADDRHGGRHFWASLSIESAPGDSCRRIFDDDQSAIKLQHL
jgi:hypothetical protein